MIKFLSHFINSRSTFKNLLILNGILSCLLFYFFRDLTSGDEKHYLSYAQGLEYGRFSQWWFLPNYIPDTIRTPGYPVFLFLIEKISSSIYFIKAIQFLMYVLSVVMILNVAASYDKGYRLRNIFLLLLLPYVQLAIFTVAIQPEALMTFLLTLYIFIDSKPIKPEWKITFLGLLSGCIFLVGPIFLFFPLIMFIISIVSKRNKFSFGLGLSMVIIYLLTILPYGIWNLKNHNVISLTPIESAGGDKISLFSSLNQAGNNMIDQSNESDYIDSACAQYLSPNDRINLAEMNNYNGFQKTYNAKYTLAKEKLLKEQTLNQLKEEPASTLKSKISTMFRLWLNEMQLSELKNPDLNKKFVSTYFTVITLVFFLASLILIPWAFYKKKISWLHSQTVIVLIVYFGVAHIFFSLQAKYTIPLRLIILLLLARTIVGLFSHTKETLK